MLLIDVSAVTQELGRTNHFVTREFGAILYPRFEEILKTSTDNVFVLDFKNIDIVDFSCPNEVFGRLIPELKSFGDKYVFLTNLNNSQRDNMAIALKEGKIAMLELVKNKVEIIGHIPDYLLSLFEQINEKKELTAREVADQEHLKISTVSSKLLSLWKSGFVQRKDIVTEEGKQFYYRSVIELI